VIDIVPIYKGKGDKAECDNHRPISIIDMFSKAFGHLLKERVESVVEGKLLEAQAGFRERRSCQDMVFILRLLRGYSREVKRAVYGCFVDLRKAYDSVDRQTLWEVLAWYGVEGNLLEMIKLLYNNLRATIRTAEGRTEEFSIKAGVKQGCVLSPLLFNMYLDFVVRQALRRFGERGVKMGVGEEKHWHDPVGAIRGMEIRGYLLISALLYADDTALVALSYEEVCEMIQILEDVTSEWGLTISIAKTKILVFGAEEGEERPPMVLRGEIVEEVQEFKYLGSIFTSVGGDTRDLKNRISKAWGCFHRFKRHVWRQKAFKLGSKLKIYRMTVLPTLLYGGESWALTDEEEEELEKTQMSMLRSIMRISLKDHRTNVEIRDRAGVSAIRDILRTARLRWFKKVMEMGDERWPKQVLCGFILGNNSRPRGRPALRWTDKVKLDLQAAGMDIEKAAREVKGKWSWNFKPREVKEGGGHPCGGECKFVAKSKGGLTNHRRVCPIYNTIQGKETRRGDIPCGGRCPFIAKNEGGLKTHRKRCRIFNGKKDKKGKKDHHSTKRLSVIMEEQEENQGGTTSLGQDQDGGQGEIEGGGKEQGQDFDYANIKTYWI
jgi:hypothetical protein